MGLFWISNFLEEHIIKLSSPGMSIMRWINFFFTGVEVPQKPHQENHRVPHRAPHPDEDHLEDMGMMGIEGAAVALGREGVAGVRPERFRCSNFI